MVTGSALPLAFPTLRGDHVILEPLAVEHVDALAAVGLDPEIWRWSPEPVRTGQDMAAYVAAAIRGRERGEMLPFATRLRRDDRLVGSTRFGAIDLANRRVEIGWTWIAPAWQRTAVNTEAKLLMLEHAFEVLDCRRVELKTDALNQRSRTAIARLGARQEGILRKHMSTASGRVRDSVYFSIVDDEWPAVREALRAKLRAHAGGAAAESG